jgi:hypothetical protein
MIVVFMVVIPIFAALAVFMGGVWLTGELSLVGLVILAAGLVGTGLVAYFDWRAKLQRQILRDAEDDQRAA